MTYNVFGGTLSLPQSNPTMSAVATVPTTPRTRTFIVDITFYNYNYKMDLMGFKPNPLDLSSFSALTLLVGSFDP